MNKYILLILFLALPILTSATPAASIVVNVSEDSFIVADFNNPSDDEHLRERNLGSLDFVKTWYAWKVLKKEMAASYIYFKFDVSLLKNKSVQWSAIQLFTKSADTTFVSAHLVRGNWTESTLTFNNAPPFETESIAVIPINSSNCWYTWDLNQQLLKEINKGSSTFSVALMID